MTFTIAFGSSLVRLFYSTPLPLNLLGTSILINATLAESAAPALKAPLYRTVENQYILEKKTIQSLPYLFSSVVSLK